MIRTVMRFAKWKIGPDLSEGASPPLYEMECTTCGERSRPEEVGDDAQQWALVHSGRNPTHTGYRALITSFWRTEMVDDPAPRPGLTP